MAELDELRRLVNGYQVTQAIHVAVTLGIPDLLAEGSRGSDELAAETESHAPTLYRLLRALASVGILHEDGERRFTLTPLGQGFRSDAEPSLAAWTRFVGRHYHWEAWGHLLHGVRTGENPFQHLHGESIWEYRAKRPEESVIFDDAMTALTRLSNQALVEAYDFGRFGVVVDVGGGHGALLAAILGANPRVRGVLFDQPHVVAGAEVGERCDVVAGSFFDAVPEGGDAYMLKAIIHDWEDAEAVAILGVCRRSMHPGAALLVIERELGGPNELPQTKFSDLNMLVAPGGRERSQEEYAALFAAAGFELVGVTPAGGGMCVFEGAAV